MRVFKKGPLLVMLAFTILIYQMITGVPKILAFAEKQMQKPEYEVETIPPYQDRDEELSAGNVTGDELSGDQVSGDSISGDAVSAGDLSGNTMSENSITDNGVPADNVTGADQNVGGQEEPAYTQVDDSYFADAVFIGDSRTVGLGEYSGMDQATFYASTGLTVYRLFDEKIVNFPGIKGKITVEEALKRKPFGKIYFMIGINEMGTGTVDTFMEKYEETVNRMRELQPDAIIYVQAIMRVTTERSDKGDYINNEGIDARNERIAQLADNEHIFYLDVNPQISDDTGGMNKDYTFDGVHLKAEYIPIWMDYLYSHGIVR